MEKIAWVIVSILLITGFFASLFFVYALGWVKQAKRCKKLLKENSVCVTCEDLLVVDNDLIYNILGWSLTLFLLTSGPLTALLLFIQGHIVLGFALSEALIIILLLLSQK